MQLRHGLDDLENLWRGLFVHQVSDVLLARAAGAARTHWLRAYDAVHLAAALTFAAGEELEFACWDRELRQAAHGLGFALVPERL